MTDKLCSGSQAAHCQEQDPESHSPDQRPAHPLGSKGVQGIKHPTAGNKGSQEAEDKTQTGQGDIGPPQGPALAPDNCCMYKSTAGQPGNKGGVFHRIPGPIPSPSQFHIRPPGPEDNSSRQKDPGNQSPVPDPVQPGIVSGQDCPQSCRRRHSQPGITDKKQWRMKYHSWMLKQGIEAIAVTWRWGKLYKRVADSGGNEQKKSLDQGVDKPEGAFIALRQVSAGPRCGP